MFYLPSTTAALEKGRNASYSLRVGRGGSAKSKSSVLDGSTEVRVPEDNVSLMDRIAGEPFSKNNPFTDVKAVRYYYNAVLWAVENQITNGTSATIFSPNKTCTRAQIVTFLYRYRGEEPEPVPCVII